MKLGLTFEEKVQKEKLKEGTRVVLALLPKYCRNTARWVWLEPVYKVYTFNCSHFKTFNHYEEIIKEKNNV